MRVFVSIGWSKETINYLENYQQILKEQGIKAHWRRGENLHLTLKFIGEVTAQEIYNIDQTLRNMKAKFDPFKVELQGLGTFPNINNPRILWVGLQGTELLQLQQGVELKLAKLGYRAETRPYKPHITLASGGISGLSKELLQQGKSILKCERISEFALMESLVEKGVRVYKVINAYDL